jgi:hypothetical protein
MADVDPRIMDLATRLLEQTREGKLEWREAGENRFAVGLTNGSVSISGRDNPNAFFAGSAGLTIHDKDGNAVERVMVPSGVFGTTPSASERELSQTLQQVFQAARRQVLGIDKTVDAILEELQPE